MLLRLSHAIVLQVLCRVVIYEYSINNLSPICTISFSLMLALFEKMIDCYEYE